MVVVGSREHPRWLSRRGEPWRDQAPPFRYLGAAVRTEADGACRVLRGAAAGAYFDEGDDRRVFSPSALSWAWWRGHAQTN